MDENANIPGVGVSVGADECRHRPVFILKIKRLVWGNAPGAAEA